MACSIIDNDRRVAHKKASAKNDDLNFDESKDSIPLENYNKVFADQVSHLKKKTNFVFHKAKVPFDISNVSQD